MSLETITRSIQTKVGATPDGIYGMETATMADRALGGEPSVQGDIFLGTGKNITRLFIHCTATREGQPFDVEAIRRMHIARGFSAIGYHFLLQLDGTINPGRSEHVVGAHAKGYNTGSLAIAYVGGLDSQGAPKDTRTAAQKASMERWCRQGIATYPGAELLGHRDISPDLDGDGIVEPHEYLKACPCFDVREWWASVQ